MGPSSSRSPFLAVRCTSAPTDSTWSEAVTASGKNMPPADLESVLDDAGRREG